MFIGGNNLSGNLSVSLWRRAHKYRFDFIICKDLADRLNLLSTGLIDNLLSGSGILIDAEITLKCE